MPKEEFLPLTKRPFSPGPSHWLIHDLDPGTPWFGGEYNPEMARGWESKSIEAQQAEAVDQPAKARVRISREQAASIRERENLRLARQRVLQQLQVTSNSLHRKLLEDSLADLDEKLSRL
jgi:hypothetical protein